MDRPETQSQCVRTCRGLRPDDPDTWCDACIQIEAEAREENWRRWNERTRRENLARWTERFAILEEARRALTAPPQ